MNKFMRGILPFGHDYIVTYFQIVAIGRDCDITNSFYDITIRLNSIKSKRKERQTSRKMKFRYNK